MAGTLLQAICFQPVARSLKDHSQITSLTLRRRVAKRHNQHSSAIGVSAKGRPKAYFRENRDAVQKEELTITNRLVLALSLAVCTLGLSVSGNAQGPRITTFNDPSAGTAAGQGTYPLAINPSGPITGISVDANNLNHGFLRGPDGGFITFEAPGIGTGAWQGTIPYAVNPSG